MGRVKLTVAYDGTAYSGWQIQPNAVTVEGVLTDALSRLLQEPVALLGASRTDAGVHALGNVAAFDTEHPIPPEKIAYAVNAYLPDDIRVMRSEAVAPDFHPRFDCYEKCYEYRITIGAFASPLTRLYAHHQRRPLDVAAMEQAAQAFVGTHDFSSFCSAGAQVQDKVRTISSLHVQELERLAEDGEDGGSLVAIRVVGNGFLYNMVRILAGTLMQVGNHERRPEEMSAVLEAKDRRKAGPTAPAKGLRLCYIRYGEEKSHNK
ncbi:MAG: tRNA pseudouridine(38-40) synthase TruA [Lachnospiraceae bacterium]|nr:tRNA pseudouridine(38-40) synthase TruA [Lachnospiraceae bacterium]